MLATLTAALRWRSRSPASSAVKMVDLAGDAAQFINHLPSAK
jgi:hypothetical protein